jgi:segregation and condensation protein B
VRQAEEEPWDDRLVADARHLVALLFVAGKPLPRVEAAQQPRISAARLAAACAYLVMALPRLGLALEEHQAQLTLVSAGDCAPVVERYLQVPAPEPLSGAALQVLAIVAYEQPVTRADIERIRGVESGTVVDTLLGRRMLAEDRRGIGRGSSVPLVTTPEFLRSFGLSSLADLPPLLSIESRA